MSTQKNRTPQTPKMQAAPAKKSSSTIYLVGAAVLVAVVAWAALRGGSSKIPEGTVQHADLGVGLHMQSLSDALPIPYNSNPPTSGWHVGSMIAPWGIQAAPVDDRVSVHNIEHGGIIIHYKQSLDAASVTLLTALTGELQRRNQCIILVPRPDDQMDAPVVLTAWTYKLSLQNIDTAVITAFFEALVGHGPEPICTPVR